MTFVILSAIILFIYFFVKINFKGPTVIYSYSHHTLYIPTHCSSPSTFALWTSSNSKARLPAGPFQTSPPSPSSGFVSFRPYRLHRAVARYVPATSFPSSGLVLCRPRIRSHATAAVASLQSCRLLTVLHTFRSLSLTTL